MTLRVTHRSLFTSNLSNLQQNLSRIQRTQGQLSSGKVLANPSDDPGGTSSALRQRSEIARNEQLGRNIDDGLGWLQSADSALDGVSNGLQRARELIVGAANTGTLSQTGADAIAGELRAIREQLVTLANTEYGGRPIFAGTSAHPSAYDIVDLDPPDPARPEATMVEYRGTDTRVARSVRPGTVVDVSVLGNDAFGDIGAGTDVFAFLDRVATDLEDGNWGSLSSAIATADSHLERAWAARSTVGAKYAQLEAMRNRTDEEHLLLNERLSEIEDIDLPKTIVDLQLQETAYQAALSATARSVQPSLLDFLR